MNIVHVVGVGTIGAPLLGLLSRHKKEFGIDEVTFHKNNPLKVDLANVLQFEDKGAILCTDREKFPSFRDLGLNPVYTREEAINRASVVIDCTPKGVGLQNKKAYYVQYVDDEKGFIAQGSEFGFGKPYAYGINEEAFTKSDGFVHVVSCNTHNLAILVKTLSRVGSVKKGNFVCIRRASDISQDDDFSPGVEVDKHKDERFGTHHARDAFELFKTLNRDANAELYSSSCKINSQYMHTIHFNIEIEDTLCVSASSDSFKAALLIALKENPYITLTHKTTSNRVFSFGRDHGHYGRILTHTVISLPTLQITEIFPKRYRVTGFCFTPQDGNSLMSSMASALWFLSEKNWDIVKNKMKCLSKYIFASV